MCSRRVNMKLLLLAYICYSPSTLYHHSMDQLTNLSQQMLPSVHYCGFGLLTTLCNDLSSYAKVGGQIGCNLFICNCYSKDNNISASFY